MATPLEQLPDPERALVMFLESRAIGMERAIVARLIAVELTMRTGERWSWRRVMRVKENLVKDYGYNICGWKGGSGYPAGLSIPGSDEEWQWYLAQMGRTINSHARLHREFKRTIIREKSGQVLMFGVEKSA